MIYKTSCLALFYEKIENDRFQLTKPDASIKRNYEKMKKYLYKHSTVARVDINTLQSFRQVL